MTFTKVDIDDLITLTRDSNEINTILLKYKDQLQPLSVSITANASTGLVPMSVAFNSTVSGGTPTYTYSWDFGDGLNDTTANPTHVYQSVGAFFASLTVTDSIGNIIISNTITINVLNPLGITVSYIINPSTGYVPITASFSSITSGGLTPYSYASTDGTNTSTLPNWTFTYTAAGSYNVTTNVTDSVGNSTSTSNIITAINPPLPPTVTIQASPLSGQTPLTVTAILSTTNGLAPFTSLIDWGDGTTSTSGGSHTYNNSGQYTIKATVTDSLLQVGTNTVLVTVTNPPPVQTTFPLALWIQYAPDTDQTTAYQGLTTTDEVRYRISGPANNNNNPWNATSPHWIACKKLNGIKGADFLNYSDLAGALDDKVVNGVTVKGIISEGMKFVEYNVEPGFSPDKLPDGSDGAKSDGSGVVKAYTYAANLVHSKGLKIRASPAKAWTTTYGAQIAPLVDWFHIQAQSLQQDPIAYAKFVNDTIKVLRQANPNLVISVQVTPQQGAAPGLTVAQTMQKCWTLCRQNQYKPDALGWFMNNSNVLTDIKPLVDWFQSTGKFL